MYLWPVLRCLHGGVQGLPLAIAGVRHIGRLCVRSRSEVIAIGARGPVGDDESLAVQAEVTIGTAPRRPSCRRQRRARGLHRRPMMLTAVLAMGLWASAAASAADSGAEPGRGVTGVRGELGLGT